MNARLSSMLVAGGVVLAGMQVGSPLPAATQSAPRTQVLQGLMLEPRSPEQVDLVLGLPGYAGLPQVQVLHAPERVVVDLPGVIRGAKPSKKDLGDLSHPLILRSRIAQFSTQPEVTRMVLEVPAGTQALVSLTPDGLRVGLKSGQGAVQARVQATPVLAPLPVPLTTPMETEVITAKAAPVVAPLPAPLPTALPQRAGFTMLSEEAGPVSLTDPAALVPTAPMVARLPLAPLPSVGLPYQTLPGLASASLLPAAPGLQDRPATAPPSPKAEGNRVGRSLGEVTGRYTGTRMTIDVKGTDIQDFLRLIAESAKLNLVVDQDVTGSYTFNFNDTPWDQVLDVILKHAGLGKEIDNGVLRVAKIEKLQKEQEDRKKLDEAKSLAGDLSSITRPLSFTKAADAKGVLDKMLTKRGSIIVDDRTNTLIISELPQNLKLLDDLIVLMDVQIQQVQIEARVVEANKGYEKSFGVKWPTSNSGSSNLSVDGQAAPWVSSNGPSWNGINNRGNSGNSAWMAFSPGKDGVTSLANPAGEFWVSFLSSRFSVNVILQALETDGIIKIVSNPKVVGQNNKKAKILSGEKIPYPTIQGGASGGAITVAFIDANLELDVTPQITNDGSIIMELKIEKSEADFSRQVNGTPTILRKAIETQVLVRDGGTAVLGGVYVTKTQNGVTGVPFLSKLPILGGLFRTKTNKENNAELLIFITPRIIR